MIEYPWDERGEDMRYEEEIRYRKYLIKKRRKRMRQLKIQLGVVFLLCILFVLGGLKILGIGPFRTEYVERSQEDMVLGQPELDVQLLTQNPYSRPGTSTEKIRDIVIHYTGNPGTSAKQNRDYFESLKDTKERKASSHFIVGLDGEIVQCVPTWEIAYASNNRNIDTVSIETCHLKADGKYTGDTYRSLVQLTAWLCEKFGLTEEDVIRHYDVTGKICPKYFVDDEQAWQDFKDDVKQLLEEK